MFVGRPINETSPIARSFSQLQDDGRVARDDRQERENKLSRSREKSVSNSVFDWKWKKEDLGSISPTFYEQLLRSKIPKAQKSCLT